MCAAANMKVTLGVAILLCCAIASVHGFRAAGPVFQITPLVAQHDARAPEQPHPLHRPRALIPYSDKERATDKRIMQLRLSHRETATQILRLQRQLHGLESMVHGLCATLLHCDDVALMERQAQGIGDIYLDSGFGSSRRPRMLRQEIGVLMLKYNISVYPLQHSWMPVANRTAADELF